MIPSVAEPAGVGDPPEYELIDAGDGRRLERFGDRIVDRPSPVASGLRGAPEAWRAADLRYEAGHGWTATPGGSLDPWPIRVAPLTLELRPTPSGQVGLFPDHLASLSWLRDQVGAAAARHGPRPEALNLFAFTGLATLALAAAGAAVVHVDSSRPAVGWARANAQASDLASRPIRWLIDDATAFCRREVRRRRRYEVIVLDPPTYGHGPRGRGRRLDEDLGTLVSLTAALLAPSGSLLVTAHTPGLDEGQLADVIRGAVGPDRRLETGALALDARTGARLELGVYVRTASRP